MTFPNQGAADLVAALAAEKPKPMSLYKAALELELSANYLSRLVAADSTVKPSRELAIKLLDRFGVDIRAWDVPFAAGPDLVPDVPAVDKLEGAIANAAQSILCVDAADKVRARRAGG